MHKTLTGLTLALALAGGSAAFAQNTTPAQSGEMGMSQEGMEGGAMMQDGMEGEGGMMQGGMADGMMQGDMMDMMDMMAQMQPMMEACTKMMTAMAEQMEGGQMPMADPEG